MSRSESRVSAAQGGGVLSGRAVDNGLMLFRKLFLIVLFVLFFIWYSSSYRSD